MSSSSEQFLFPDPYPEGVQVFLIVYQILTFLLLVFVVWFLIRRRNHRVIQPRGLLTLIPFLCLSYVQGVVITISFIRGKPPFCGTLTIVFTALSVLVRPPATPAPYPCPLLLSLFKSFVLNDNGCFHQELKKKKFSQWKKTIRK